MNYLGKNKDTFKTVAEPLNKLLADYQMYYQNLRNFHWNISGGYFFELHNKFEELYIDARDKIDMVAERILAIRQKPLSMFTEYLLESDIEEPNAINSDVEMVMVILQNHTQLLKSLRTATDLASEVGDEGTVDMLGGFIGFIEKESWMMDAWLGKKELTEVNE